MRPTIGTTRRRPSAVRAVALSLCAAGALALTGCSDGASTGGAATGTDPDAARTTASGDTTGRTGRTGDGSGAASAQPASKTSAAPGSGTKAPGTKASASTPPASATTAPPDSGTGDGCDHRMPISPDEIAVYRYSPEGGSLNLIVKHGNRGCGTADSDGAPFETVGKETYLPMDQAAYVTATNPVVESSENQRIGVQEFLDWVEAHPDSGLVFTYHVGKDGAVDSLEEVFTP